jgi:hypothetical protein
MPILKLPILIRRYCAEWLCSRDIDLNGDGLQDMRFTILHGVYPGPIIQLGSVGASVSAIATNGPCFSGGFESSNVALAFVAGPK